MKSEHPRKITKLEVQKNNSTRANVYVDGEFALGIHQELILKFALHEGKHLSLEEQQEMEAADAEMKARAVALEYLAHKQRTVGEVRERLARGECPRDVIDAVVDRLVELGYLDDARYAQEYVRGRFNNRRFGPFRIRQELQERQVESRYIEEAMNLLDTQDILDAARYHGQKKWSKTAGDDSFLKRKKKTEGYLKRRGFDFTTIRTVLDELTAGIRP